MTNVRCDIFVCSDRSINDVFFFLLSTFFIGLYFFVWVCKPKRGMPQQ